MNDDRVVVLQVEHRRRVRVAWRYRPALEAVWDTPDRQLVGTRYLQLPQVTDALGSARYARFPTGRTAKDPHGLAPSTDRLEQPLPRSVVG